MQFSAFHEEVPMCLQSSANASRIEQLKAHLKAERYSAAIQRLYPPLAQRFLDYLDGKAVAIEAARPSNVDDFIRRELRLCRKRNYRVPRDPRRWRWHYTRPIHMILRLVHGRWPVVPAPATALEAFHRDLVRGYDTWMHELRGLAVETRSERTTQAQWFLNALGPCGDQIGLSRLSVPNVDAYIQQRCAGLRRQSIKDYTSNLRVFLRYLYGSAQTASDLSGAVIGPRIYDYEDIPSALRPEEVQKVLAIARQDLSPTGRRDYAMLMLLATYGLRAGEVVALRLEDLDWKKEVLRVRHSKTAAYSELPLLRAPGEALLGYLQNGRPKSMHREVFLYAHAPYRPFKRDGAGLYSAIQYRLTAAEVTPSGKKGSHAFRHARAVSLLRAAVSIKTIGDVLGHRSAHSTGVYLKLATDDLRAVGLEIPRGVSP
ncbi:MAG: site-specific integrase [Acidiferrobacterales bacterium]